MRKSDGYIDKKANTWSSEEINQFIIEDSIIERLTTKIRKQQRNVFITLCIDELEKTLYLYYI